MDDHVLTIRTQDPTTKDLLIDSGHLALFTEPHYSGFPSVPVRLEPIEPGELEDLVAETWKCKAAKEMVPKYEEINRDC